MTTAADIVTAGLKKSGIVGLGQTPDGSDTIDALADLNDMLAQWTTQRWMVWNEVDLSFVSTGQTTPYTVGPSGNYAVTPRPDRIEAAYLRQLINPPGLNVDTELKVIPSREEYSTLSLKPLVSFPLYVFLDSAYPTGNLYIYPWPNASIYETHIILKGALPVLTITSTISMPGQYIAAMKFNLAKRLRQAYGKGLRPDPELNALARSSLDIVKQSNLQVPELVMPKVLISIGSGYNIFSDQFGSGSS
jgi:hypothetical protein